MKLSKEAIDTAYWHTLLTHGKPPASVYALCHENEWSEADFYSHYSTLESIERNFWRDTVTDVVEVLEKDEDYPSYEPRQKVLAFCYTYFEHIRQYRSRFLKRFPRKPSLCALKALQKMETAYNDYLEKISQENPSTDSETKSKDCKIRENLKPLEHKGYWVKFCLLIQFYLEDESDKFESTDALIEKSVNLIFDARDTQVLEGAVDLARFLAGRMGVKID